MLRTEPTEPSATPVLVAIAEDHPDLRAGLSALLKRERGFACLGAVGTEAELWWVLAGADPDVVILDTVFDETDGLAKCFELKQGPRPPAILLYSTRADDAFATAAALAGADGIVPKNSRADVLLGAIRAAAEGRLQPLVADAVTIEAASSRLSEDDRPVMDMLLNGVELPVIARRLGVTRKDASARAERIISELQAPVATSARS